MRGFFVFMRHAEKNNGRLRRNPRKRRAKPLRKSKKYAILSACRGKISIFANIKGNAFASPVPAARIPFACSII